MKVFFNNIEKKMSVNDVISIIYPLIYLSYRDSIYENGIKVIKKKLLVFQEKH